MSVRAMKEGAGEFLTKPRPLTRPRARSRVAPGAPRSRSAARAVRAADSARARGHGVRGRWAAEQAGSQASWRPPSGRSSFIAPTSMQKMEADSVAELVRIAGHLGIAPRG